jgi:hypothetical protein
MAGKFFQMQRLQARTCLNKRHSAFQSRGNLSADLEIEVFIACVSCTWPNMFTAAQITVCCFIYDLCLCIEADLHEMQAVAIGTPVC